MIEENAPGSEHVTVHANKLLNYKEGELLWHTEGRAVYVDNSKTWWDIY
jgi:hypothetical protein